VNFYNLTTLNPNLKIKILLSFNIFLELQCVIFGIFSDFYYNYVNESIGLKSLFYVEMNMRNSKIAVRILYESNVMHYTTKM